MKNNRFLKEFLLLIVPFSLWAFFRKGFLLGDFFLHGDNHQYYYWIKYYLDNITRGVYPLWNPFFAWGAVDNFDMRFIGEFNPFLYFIPLLNRLGLSFYLSFMCYIFIYYFVGLAGFFLLSKRLFKNTLLAFISFTLLMFSSLGVAIFQQLQILLLYVPAVWFFFFLVGFAQTTEKKYLFGLTFCSMLLVTTYLPFFFLTIFLSFLVFFVLFCHKELWVLLKKWSEFFTKRKLLLVFCLFSLFLALVPPFKWYMEARGSQYVMDIKRHGTSGKHTASVSAEGAGLSSICTEASAIEIFPDLDLGNQQFSYVSLFVYLLLLLSIINKGDKRQALLFGTGFLVLLIAMADATPVHAFLYRHVYFFKLFRNYFYFLPFLVSMLILFSVEQLRLLLEHKPSSSRGKILILLFIFTAHAALGIFLYTQGSILWSSYATILGSFILFTLYFPGWIRPKSILFASVLFAVALVQPLEANLYFDHLFGKNPLPPSTVQKPSFSFKRPLKGQGKDIVSGFYGRTKVMEDMSGFTEEEYVGTSWSYSLYKSIGHDILKDYVKNKFVIYDRVELTGDIEPNLSRIERSLKGGENVAFVFDGPQNHPPAGPGRAIADKALVIQGESDQFKILKFDLNSIKFKTNFKTRKFLVYNDSYHTGWQAFINGKRTEIFRSNIAFKGIWLGPGENVVYFRYGNPYLYGFYLFLAVFFIAFLFYLIFIFLSGKHHNENPA